MADFFGLFTKHFKGGTMNLNTAMTKYKKAFNKGYSESVRTDSEPEKCRCPYKVGSPEGKAFKLGWNSHYDPAWDNE
jgi:hypothetical protein